jgi:hypothetical protein
MTHELTTLKQSVRYPSLIVKKYKRKVFYNALWCNEVMEARGHVYTADGKLVINPFTKVFNYGEQGTTINDNEQCVVVEKINGFMAALTFVPEVDDYVVSTTGSLDSPFVDMARAHFGKFVKYLMTIAHHEVGVKTYLFEICHIDDPHIIPEKEGAYLLGFRYVDDTSPYMTDVNNQIELDRIAAEAGVMRPAWQLTDFGRVKQQLAECKHEGFMVYGQDSNVVLKLKSPYYLSLKAAARVKDIATLDKTRVDEEFYDLIDHLKTTYASDWITVPEQDRLTIMRDFIKERYQ